MAPHRKYGAIKKKLGWEPWQKLTVHSPEIYCRLGNVVDIYNTCAADTHINPQNAIYSTSAQDFSHVNGGALH